MAEAFDPYLKWLGIPPKDRPPHDYRLLGIELFESDPDVISNAADQRMAHLKNFATGRHSKLSQKILNEISAARIHLLNPQEKVKYDARLRRQLGEKRSVPPKLPTAVPLPGARAQGQPVISVNTPNPAVASRPEAHGVSPGERPAWLLPAAIGAGVCAVVVVLALLLSIAGRGPGEKETGRRAVSLVDTKGTRPTDAQPPNAQPSNAQPSNPGPTGPGPADAGPAEPEPNGPESIGPQPPGPHPPEAEPPESDPPGPEPEPLQPEPPETQPAHPDPQDPEPSQAGPTQDPAEPEPAPQKTKLPEPDAEAQRERLREVREIYQQEFEGVKTPQQKLALAAQLSSDGLGTKDDPAARFVLLELAANLAAEGEDIGRALGIIDQMDEIYTIDVLDRKADALATVAKTLVRRPGAMAAAQQIVNTARQLTDEALSTADVEAAGRLVKIALPAARKLRDRKLIAVLQNSGKDLEHLQSRFELVKKAVAALEAKPDHPQANLVAGSWHCFVAGDWDKGLPWLVKGENAELAALASRDLANPQQAGERAALGDAWWELSETRKGLEKSRLQTRAGFWYRKALPGLSGLARTKLEKRIDEMGLQMGQYALKFDGQKSHVVIRNFGYAGPSPITVEAIVQLVGNQPPRRIGIPPSLREQAVLSNLTTSGLALSSYAGRWNFKFYYSYKSSTTSSYVYSGLSQCSASSYATTGKWIHLAGVYDGTQIRLFADGQLQNSYAISRLHTHKASLFPFILGAAPARTASPAALPVTHYFQGLIRAVRISNAPLYAQNFQPPEELENQIGRTMLLFRFGEGRGDRLKDAAGRKAFGEITGAEWVKLD